MQTANGIYRLGEVIGILGIWKGGRTETAYECLRRGDTPKNGLGFGEGHCANGISNYSDERDKNFAPRCDHGYWEAFPLETWLLAS